MEKRKKFTKRRGFQLLCLISFAGMALACSSSKDVQQHMDDFVDGYQYGRSLRSEINVDLADSLNNSTYDVAILDDKTLGE